MEISKKNLVAIFSVILLLGTFLRVYNLSTLSFTADEFLGVNTAYGYLKTGEWKRWDFNLDRIAEDKAYAHTLFDFSSEESAASGSYTRAWMYNWQVAKAISILSPKVESSFRIVSVFWGILSIAALYFVGKKMTGQKIIGLIAAFLFAINISGIIFDRTVRMYSMFFPVYLMMSYFIFKMLEGKESGGRKIISQIKKRFGINLLYVLPTILVAALAFHLHLLASNIILVVLIYLIYKAASEWKKTTKFFNLYARYVAMILGIFLVSFILLPQYISPFLSSFTLTDHFSYLGKIFSDFNNPLLAITLIILGVYSLWREKKNESAFLAASFFVPALSAIFLWDRNPGDQYIFFVKSFELILIASAVYFLANFFSKRFPGKEKMAYIGSILAVLLLLPNYGYFFEENNVYRQNSRSEDPNYKKVFAYYMKNKKDGEVLVTRWFRNYYFPRANAELITFGGERSEKDEKKINGERLRKIHQENPCGWFIWSSSDDAYITADAKEYARKNFEQINDVAVRGDITVNYWCDKK